MGAQTFITYAEGADVDAAFRATVEQAEYEYGHAGRSGTIAEKNGYVVINGGPLSPGDAAALANTLIDGADRRIDDKWEPAGAIAVLGGIRTLSGIPVPPRSGGYPDLKTAALAAVDGLLGDDEIVTKSHLDRYSLRRGSIEIDQSATAIITTTGSAKLTGWLFFGRANS
ncbi:hypothetical protein [Umezawaea sp. Da 62-37]|uniref:hypothetical protein n=1 Tax=Umezawaea sp. Da 62-37 TaxID=3075927 RepID=UPI0028F74DC0|nr:hypothetical protein [Umezawaea sp. Da 62-37]WNV83091.1 hypothetical protein RM788_33545 [Umezawaea sp. Da 62-37]